MTTTAPELTRERPGFRRKAKAYFELTKPRVIELLLVSTVPTMILAQRGIPEIWLILATVIGGAFSAGSANSFNCYIDADIDKIMGRTKGRPLVTGELSKREAYWFAWGLGVLSVVWLALLVNVLAALLSLAAILFYVFVYTLLLKRRTPQNIVWGGAAGSMPVLIGWAAVTNELAPAAWVLFLIIFLWTPPHFWALALYRVEDYRKSGLPMLPVTHGSEFTRLHIFLYTLVLFAACLLPFIYGMSSWLYLVVALGLSVGFCVYAWRLLRNYSEALSRATFRFSLIHLSALFAALLLDHYLL